MSEKSTGLPWRTIKHSWSTIGIYADDSRVAKDWRIGELDIQGEATEENQETLEAIMEANAELIVRCVNAHDEILAALEKLVQQLEAVHKDPQYKGVWTLHHVHGGRYSGLTYEKELKQAKSAIEKAREG